MKSTELFIDVYVGMHYFKDAWQPLQECLMEEFPKVECRINPTPEDVMTEPVGIVIRLNWNRSGVPVIKLTNLAKSPPEILFVAGLKDPDNYAGNCGFADCPDDVIERAERILKVLNGSLHAPKPT